MRETLAWWIRYSVGIRWKVLARQAGADGGVYRARWRSKRHKMSSDAHVRLVEESAAAAYKRDRRVTGAGQWAVGRGWREWLSADAGKDKGHGTAQRREVEGSWRRTTVRLESERASEREKVEGTGNKTRQDKDG